ncbi:hypothetical protein EDC01DRAFT_672437 [Geopyxis carbonaria]|nr:hypothetical protein EDC01DRAFT_672437 [Geopyxis carbonaria]
MRFSLASVVSLLVLTVASSALPNAEAELVERAPEAVAGDYAPKCPKPYCPKQYCPKPYCPKKYVTVTSTETKKIYKPAETVTITKWKPGYKKYITITSTSTKKIYKPAETITSTKYKDCKPHYQPPKDTYEPPKDTY